MISGWLSSVPLNFWPASGAAAVNVDNWEIGKQRQVSPCELWFRSNNCIRICLLLSPAELTRGLPKLWFIVLPESNGVSDCHGYSIL